MEVIDKRNLEDVKSTIPPVTPLPRPKKGTTPKTVEMLGTIALGFMTIFFDHCLIL